MWLWLYDIVPVNSASICGAATIERRLGEASLQDSGAAVVIRASSLGYALRLNVEQAALKAEMRGTAMSRCRSD